MNMFPLLSAALGMSVWLVAASPLAWAWMIACRRRMPREARRSFAWVCLLAAHGVAALAAVVVVPLWTVGTMLAPWPDAVTHAWVQPLWNGLEDGVIGLVLGAGAVTALVLPLKLCRVWPSMRAAARMHVMRPADPAERRD